MRNLFRVYYEDGNQKLFEADSKKDLREYLIKHVEETGAVTKIQNLKAKYAVYYTWNDGFEDSINCKDAEERDLNIKDMLERKDFKEIKYCRIYANGEYGKETKVL
jgi:hypothetical protein